MKQHITLEQLNELSEKGQKKLREWWKPEEGDWIVGKEFPYGKKYEGFELCISSPAAGFLQGVLRDKGTLPLLSIGQMIEFLDGRVHKVEQLIQKGGSRWEVFIDYRAKEIPEVKFANKKELCDALWEAVKEVLEEN